MHKVSLLAVVVVLYPASNVRAQSPENAGAHYSFEFVVPPGAPTNSPIYALGINDDASVVGYYPTQNNCYEPGDLCEVGYLKDGTGYHNIYFGSAGYTFVWGINDSGTIVGTCCGIHSAHAPGFEYDPQSGSFDLVLAPGSQATFLTSINSLGVIGGYSEVPGTTTTGFLLQNGTFTQSAYPGASATYVYGVNSSGQVVGNAVIGVVSQAFLYQNGTFQPISYPGAASTSANGINDGSDIVGAYTLPGSTVIYGFIYHGGVYSPFDQPNCNGSIPQGVNNHGAIVGETCNGAFVAIPKSN